MRLSADVDPVPRLAVGILIGTEGFDTLLAVYVIPTPHDARWHAPGKVLPESVLLLGVVEWWCLLVVHPFLELDSLPAGIDVENASTSTEPLFHDLDLGVWTILQLRPG